jgi:nitroreductase / dihydropteridine reductase
MSYFYRFIEKLCKMNHIIRDLNWRYATKKFDSSLKISEENFAILKEAMRLSPSSYGLQLYKFIVIENSSLREKLKQHSWNQNQITDASHLIVLCRYSAVNENHINQMMKLTAELREISLVDTQKYADFLKMTIRNFDVEKMSNWTTNQVYIALGFLMQTAASLKIDSCPIEGFENDAYDAILNLNEKGLKSVVVCALGYRDEKDVNQFKKKVRRNHSDLFELI